MLAVIACDKDTPATPTPVVVSVTVSGQLSVVGQSAPFTAVALLSNGTTEQVSAAAAWSTSNVLVATVTPSGVVTAIGFGTVDISATYRAVVGSTRFAIAGPTPPEDSFGLDYIQSLFLGSGALTPTEGTHGCPRRGVWVGFPRGTQVRMRVSSNVGASIFNALVAAANQIPAASVGALTTTVESTPEGDPLPSRNEVTVMMSPNAQNQGCPLAQGCTRFVFEGSHIFSARAILSSVQPAGAYVHDAIGHGVMGLCHVDGNLIGGPRLSLMSFGVGIFSSNLPLQLTSFDTQATQAVYGSSLAFGSTMTDFALAGLIRPPVPTSVDRHRFGSVGTPGVIDAPPAR